MNDINDEDCIILAVAHNEFKQLSAEKLSSIFKQGENEESVLVDAKGIVPKLDAEKAGLLCWRL